MDAHRPGPVSRIGGPPEVHHIAAHPLPVQSEFLHSPAVDHVLAQGLPKRIEGLTEGVPGPVGGVRGPEEDCETIATLGPDGAAEGQESEEGHRQGAAQEIAGGRTLRIDEAKPVQGDEA